MTPAQRIKSLKQTILFPTDFQVWQAKQGEPEGRVIVAEAMRILTKLQAKAQRQRLSLSYEAALRVVGSELLNVLHWQGRVRICKECPPYVVYVYTDDYAQRDLKVNHGK